jgi:DNA-binding NtrC family response regulator
VRRRGRPGNERLRFLVRVHTDGRNNAEVDWLPLTDAKLTIGRESGASLFTLDDPEASRRHADVEYVRDSDVHRLRDLASRNNTFLDGQKIDVEYLQHGSVIRIGGSLLIYAELSLSEGVPPFRPEGVASLARLQAETLVDIAAPSELPILIHGPTGAGKELLAHRAHDKSGRPGSLVAINCSTFTKELIGSELFGHTSGAFSGAASSRSGLFLSASHGTIFLDEIAELPLEQQPALLRVLQEGRVRPLGSDREVVVDVRVVAASHQRLAELEARGSFRSDLHARLAGFAVDLPGLSARREEILGLFAAFLGPNAPPLLSDAAEAILLYEWPHNVRELKHTAERLKLLSKNHDAIDLGLLPSAIRRHAIELVNPDDEAPSKAQLESLLRDHQGNVAQVARALGCHRQQVYRWLQRHELDATTFRSSD